MENNTPNCSGYIITPTAKIVPGFAEFCSALKLKKKYVIFHKVY